MNRPSFPFLCSAPLRKLALAPRLTPLIAATLAATAVLAVAPAQAALITYGFSGEVQHDDADRGWDTFSGSLRYDSSTPDAIPGDAQTAAYLHSGAPWGLELQFSAAGSVVETVSLTASLALLVSNDLMFGGTPEDQLGVLATDSSGLATVSLTLWQFAATLFGNDALPGGGLTLASFDWNEFSYDVDGSRLQGRLTALACSAGCGTPTEPGDPTDPTDPTDPNLVPLPGTLTLALAGMALLCSRPRRR